MNTTGEKLLVIIAVTDFFLNENMSLYLLLILKR